MLQSLSTHCIFITHKFPIYSNRSLIPRRHCKKTSIKICFFTLDTLFYYTYWPRGISKCNLVRMWECEHRSKGGTSDEKGTHAFQQSVQIYIFFKYSKYVEESSCSSQVTVYMRIWFSEGIITYRAKIARNELLQS